MRGGPVRSRVASYAQELYAFGYRPDGTQVTPTLSDSSESRVQNVIGLPGYAGGAGCDRRLEQQRRVVPVSTSSARASICGIAHRLAFSPGRRSPPKIERAGLR